MGRTEYTAHLLESMDIYCMKDVRGKQHISISIRRLEYMAKIVFPEGVEFDTSAMQNMKEESILWILKQNFPEMEIQIDIDGNIYVLVPVV